MAYVPEKELDDGFKVLKSLASELKGKKLKQFGINFLDYFERVWLKGTFGRSAWNMHKHRGKSSNNVGEGYNSRINNIQEIKPKPNPYLLCAFIKDELNLAEMNKIAADVAKPNSRRQDAKAARLEQNKKDLIKHYDKFRPDLRVYMVAIGAAAIDNDIKILATADDFDPNEKDEFDSTATITLSTSPSVSLTGEALRNARANYTIDYDKSGTIDYSKSVLSPLNKSKSKVLRPNIERGPEEDLLTLNEGKALAKATMKSMGFKVSPSQPITPGDGNCFCHALVDQLSNDRFLADLFTHDTIRSYVVLNAEIIVKTNALELPPCIDKNDKSKNPKILPFDMKGWKNLMGNDGYYCDQLFIQLASEILNRKFILVPVHYECGHGNGIIKIDPLKQPIGDPLYFLYYTESK
jgi:hypothetical protein